MKKIAIDVRCLMEENLTGVGEYTFNLLKNLFDIDHTNQYFLFFNKRNPYTKHIDHFKKGNVKFCEFHYPNKLLNSSIRFFGRPFLDLLVESKCRTKIDLFFFPNINFLSISPICKYIITGHDLSFEIFPSFFSLKRRMWHRAVKSRELFNNAHKVIAISQNTKKDLINWYNINPNKIQVIYSGINLKFPEYTNLEIRKKYSLPDKFILGLGTLEPRKNIETLIEAFNILRKNNKFDHKLVIAGPRGWKFKNIFKLVEKLDLKNQIIFTGYIDINDKPYIYKLADVFVYPSYYEGFGFPPLEAMASKTPVITSHTSSLSEICENAAITIDPYNPNELAFTINQVITDENLKNNLISCGYMQSQKFKWEKTAKEFLQAIN